MKNSLAKLSRSRYRPGLTDLVWVAFMLFGLAMGLLGLPKSAFYGLAFGVGIFGLRAAGLNRSLTLWFTAMSLLQLTAETAGWYGIPNFDKLIHALFPVIGSLAVYALLVRYGLAPRPSKTHDRHPRFTLALLVFLLAVAEGALWEIIEFTSDTVHLFPGLLQHGNIDTMTDIVATFVGAFLAGWVAVRIWYKNKES